MPLRTCIVAFTDHEGYAIPADRTAVGRLADYLLDGATQLKFAESSMSPWPE